MADVKISGLPAASSCASTDEAALNQSGTSRKGTLAQLFAASGIASTYTPTLTNGTNVAASTAYPALYVRIGNVVLIAGIMDIDPTTSGATSQIDISVPVASDFTNGQQAGGIMCATATTTAEIGAITSDGTNNRLRCDFISQTTANHTVAYIAAYQVL